MVDKENGLIVAAADLMKVLFAELDNPGHQQRFPIAYRGAVFEVDKCPVYEHFAYVHFKKHGSSVRKCAACLSPQSG